MIKYYFFRPVNNIFFFVTKIKSVWNDFLTRSFRISHVNSWIFCFLWSDRFYGFNVERLFFFYRGLSNIKYIKHSGAKRSISAEQHQDFCDINIYTPRFRKLRSKNHLFLMWYINVVVSDLLINTDVCSRCGDIRPVWPATAQRLLFSSKFSFFPFLFLFFIVQLQLAWTGAFRGKQSSLVFLCPTECDVQPARGKQQTPPKKHKIKFTHDTGELGLNHNNSCRLTNYECFLF